MVELLANLLGIVAAIVSLAAYWRPRRKRKPNEEDPDARWCAHVRVIASDAAAGRKVSIFRCSSSVVGFSASEISL